MAITDSPLDDVYPFELRLENDTYVISSRPLFAALLQDLGEQAPVGVISARFHNGLVELFVEIANILRERSSLNRVCLSGGSFNNVYLAENLRGRLRADRFQVFTQNEVPSGDGGISLRQAMIAAHSLE